MLEPTVCKLGALSRQVDLQGVFVKIGDITKFKGFVAEFPENKRSWEKKNSRKSPEKWTFSEPRLVQRT